MVGLKHAIIHWQISVIPALWRLKQENGFEFLDFLAVLMRAYLKKREKKGRRRMRRKSRWSRERRGEEGREEGKRGMEE